MGAWFRHRLFVHANVTISLNIYPLKTCNIVQYCSDAFSFPFLLSYPPKVDFEKTFVDLHPDCAINGRVLLGGSLDFVSGGGLKKREYL